MPNLVVHNISYLEEGYSIKDFNFEFESGKFYGIIAPAEEHISTFLKLISGIVEPKSGKIILDGKDLNVGTLYDLRPLRKKISFVFERGSLLANLNVRENLLLPYDYHYPEVEPSVKLEKIAEYFEYFQLSDTLLNLRPAFLREETMKLLGIIRALLTEPECLFLDMPFTDLEIKSKKKVIQKIINLRAIGKTTLIFYSNTDILYDRCDSCLVVHQGNILFSGLWDEIMMQDSPEIRKIVKDYFELGIDET